MDAIGIIGLVVAIIAILTAVIAVIRAFSRVESRSIEFDLKLKEMNIKTDTNFDSVINLEKDLALQKQELINYKLYVAQDNKHLYETLTRIQNEFIKGMADLKRDLQEKFDDLKKQLKVN